MRVGYIVICEVRWEMPDAMAKDCAGPDVLVHYCLDLVNDEGVGGSHTITVYVVGSKI